jgi:hypothetical protein
MDDMSEVTLLISDNVYKKRAAGFGGTLFVLLFWFLSRMARIL